jgi:hypothetical protein
MFFKILDPDMIERFKGVHKTFLAFSRAFRYGGNLAGVQRKKMNDPVGFTVCAL